MTQVIASFGPYYTTVVRFVFILLTVVIVLELRRGLYRQPKAMRVLAVLDIDDGSVRLPLTHYENTIGRSDGCDVVIKLPMISRQHAVLSLAEDGLWRLADTGSKGGVLINGTEPEDDTPISIGDSINLAGLEMALHPATRIDAKKAAKEIKKKNIIDKIRDFIDSRGNAKSSVTIALISLSVFQLLAFFQLSTTVSTGYLSSLILSFGALLALPWLYRLYAHFFKIQNIFPEILAFFLCTLGISTTASAAPGSLTKQVAAMLFGIVMFCVMSYVLKNLELVMKLRLWTGIASLLLLGGTLIIGTTLNGQRNWIDLGFITIQPSEFVKILFVFTGSATLEWLLTTRNLLVLTVYSSGCIGLLFLASDFGTALIFFLSFIVLVLMTSGDIRMIVLTCVVALLGGLMIISYKPYIMNRFSSWGNIWQDVYGVGFQQTRSLMSIASGGFFGLGAGNGSLKEVVAADTDMVFAVVCEEWGLLIGLAVIACFVLLLRSAIRSNKSARSSFYIIAACTAGSIFLFQAALNIFGSTDILPFTGVTLPFISNGGTSMMASWGLLSFISAALNNVRPKTDFDDVPLKTRRRKTEVTK